MSATDGLAGHLCSIIVEGAVDRFCGRPYDRNPYSPQSAREYWEAWNAGWIDGDWMLKDRGQEEAARWLQEAA